MSNGTILGRFVWHELMTTDTKSAAAFFTKVVGWKTQAWAQDPSYSMFAAASGPAAGLMMLPEDAKAMGAPPSWLTYIGVPGVDETARQAATLGATVLRQPSDIPNVGRFAVIRDPQGAVFAIFTPAQAAPDTPATVGNFSWHELSTTDWRSALTFYQRLFRWEETNSMDMGPEMGTYQMFGWKGKTLGGMFNKSKQMPGPPFWLPYIQVADSKKAAATVKKLGGRVINGPMQVPGGDWIAQGMDLQGAVFAVHSANPTASAAPAAKPKPSPAKASKRPAAKMQAAKKTARKTAKKTKPAKTPVKKGKPKRSAGASKRARRGKPARSSKRRR